MYLRFEENILDSVLPLKKKHLLNISAHSLTTSFWDWNERREKRRKYRKLKTSVLKSEYENINQIYFEKILQKRRLYIENALMEKCSRKTFDTLKLLLGQDVEQLPNFETKNQLRNDFNDFFISKVESIIVSIHKIGPEILKTEVNSMNSFTELSISPFRALILASSNSTSPLDTITTHPFQIIIFSTSWNFLIFRWRRDFSPRPLKRPLLSPTWRKQILTMKIF